MFTQTKERVYCYINTIGELMEDFKQNKSEKAIIYISNSTKTVEEILKYTGGFKNYEHWNFSEKELSISLIELDQLKLEKIKDNPFVVSATLVDFTLNIKFNNKFDVSESTKDLRKFEKIYWKKAINDGEKEKINWKQIKNKIFDALAGILIPCVPILTVSGVLQGLYSVFTQTGVLEPVNISYSGGNISLITDFSVVSGIFYILGQMGMGFCGVYFCYTTVMYLKGNGVMGCLIGLTLATPMLYPGLQWNLFSIGGNIDIGIKAYTSSIICQVGAGFLYVYVDKLLKKFVPEAVEVIFRYTFAYLFTIIPMFLLIGPMLNIFENGIGYGLSWVGNIPFGIGLTLFAFLFSISILMGMGLVIFTLVILGLDPETGSLLYVAITIPSLAQAGAAIAIGAKTRNTVTRKIAYSLILPGLLNSTEAVVYGITFPKGRPFFMGCIAAAISGLLIYLFDVRVYSVAGGGIFANWLSFIKGGFMNVFWYFVVQFVAIIAGFLLTYPVYKERATEKELTAKTNKTIIKALAKELKLNPKEVYETLKEDLDKFNSIFSKENIKFIKNFDKLTAKVQDLRTKIINLENRDEAYKARLSLKAITCENLEKIEQVEIYNKKITNSIFIPKIELLKNKLQTLQIEFDAKISEFDAIQVNYINLSNEFLQAVNKKYNFSFDKDIKNNYINNINSLFIEHKLKERLENESPLLININ